MSVHLSLKLIPCYCVFSSRLTVQSYGVCFTRLCQSQTSLYIQTNRYVIPFMLKLITIKLL